MLLLVSVYLATSNGEFNKRDEGPGGALKEFLGGVVPLGLWNP